MNRTLHAILGCSIMVLALPATAADSMPGNHMMMDMKMMDANSDGMLSKTEFMAYHEKMWLGMKKDANGMVDAKMMATMPRTPDKK